MRAGLMGAVAVAMLTAAPAALTKVNAGMVPCGMRADIIKQLETRHGEQRRAFGKVGAKRVMEVFVSKTGSWTMLLTTTDGRACVVGAGSDWSQWKVAYGGKV
ncbi:MAG: hypothetical protein AAFR04_14160 [Pseudomonadota bacterium]